MGTSGQVRLEMLCVATDPTRQQWRVACDVCVCVSFAALEPVPAPVPSPHALSAVITSDSEEPIETRFKA